MITWIEHCIERLPFPNKLRQLNIVITTNYDMPTEPRYPIRTEYEELFHPLQSLGTHGSLERINLNIKLMSLKEKSLGDGSLEEAMLTEVFSPLLEGRQRVFFISLEHCHLLQRRYDMFLQLSLSG